jgi:hypothetical protein
VLQREAARADLLNAGAVHGNTPLGWWGRVGGTSHEWTPSSSSSGTPDGSVGAPAPVGPCCTQRPRIRVLGSMGWTRRHTGAHGTWRVAATDVWGRRHFGFDSVSRLTRPGRARGRHASLRFALLGSWCRVDGFGFKWQLLASRPLLRNAIIHSYLRSSRYDGF